MPDRRCGRASRPRSNYRYDRWNAYANYTYVDATYQSAITLFSPNNPNALTDPNNDDVQFVNVKPGDHIPGIPAQPLQGRRRICRHGRVEGRRATSTSSAASIWFTTIPTRARRCRPMRLLNLHTSYQITPNIELFGLINNVLNQHYYLGGTFFQTGGFASTTRRRPQPDGTADRSPDLRARNAARGLCRHQGEVLSRLLLQGSEVSDVSKRSSTVGGILVVDSHPIIATACRAVLEPLGFGNVVGASGADSGYAAFLEHKPDVVIVDLSLCGDKLGGLALIERIRSQDSDARILVFSMQTDARSLVLAIESGATDYLIKDAPTGKLERAVWQVRSGHRYVDPQIALKLTFPNAQLSSREKRVLALFVEGTPYATVANQLGIKRRSAIGLIRRARLKLETGDASTLSRLEAQLTRIKILDHDRCTLDGTQ